MADYDSAIIWGGGIGVLAVVFIIWRSLFAVTVSYEIATAEGTSPDHANFIFMIMMAGVIAISYENCRRVADHGPADYSCRNSTAIFHFTRTNGIIVVTDRIGFGLGRIDGITGMGYPGRPEYRCCCTGLFCSISYFFAET